MLVLAEVCGRRKCLISWWPEERKTMWEGGREESKSKLFQYTLQEYAPKDLPQTRPHLLKVQLLLNSTWGENLQHMGCGGHLQLKL